MQVYLGELTTMPTIEGDALHCVRAILFHCTAEERARIRDELAPKRGTLQQEVRVAQLEEAREELGLKPLKLFDPAAPADEEPDPLALTEYVLDPETGELWCEDDVLTLGPVDPGDDRDDDGDPVPEPTPLLTPGELAYANA